MSSAFEELRTKLSKALEQSKPDFGRILELSNQLAALDPVNVRFTADASLISRLGEQLVARQETAVSELVKNAYDADATYARLIFGGTDRVGGRLLMRDDGVGMSREELIDGFMRLAARIKIHNPQSRLFDRQRAGRKGIGRFAAQRLGKVLTLVTQTKGAEKALEVKIDWRDFEAEGNLFRIANQIREVNKERPQGTTLIIDVLREAWTDAQIQRVYRYIQDLVQPFPLAPISGNAKSKKDPGFKVVMSRLVGIKEIEVASEDKMLFQHAVAKISGRVDNNGVATWRIESSRLKIDEEEALSADSKTPNVPFSVLRSVNFAAYYFIWSEVPPMVAPSLKELVRTRGGIRLYRNGFRVFPYGDPDNDWLELDETSRRRAVLPAIANINWVGFVEIRDPEGRYFEETSSREGLLRNAAYEELVAFVLASLKAGTLRVAVARNRKGKAGKSRKDSLPPSERLKEVANDLEGIAEKMNRDARRRGQSAPAESLVLRDVAHRVRLEANTTTELIQELAMLRVLGGLGLTIAVFTHEVSHRLLNLSAKVQKVVKGLAAADPVRKLLDDVSAHVDLLESYTGYFDSAVSENVRREMQEQDIGVVLWKFIREFTPVVERDNIEFAKPDIQEELGLVTKPMHPSEWTSILTNLLTNSIKAIRARGATREKGRILIRSWREDVTLFIDFADNGIGIPANNEGRIFDAFFTTTGGGGATGGLPGTGLGLTIIRDIIVGSGGEIYVTPPPDGYATCLRIEVPAGKE
jgi:signal transduction histidine kinase